MMREVRAELGHPEPEAHETSEQPSEMQDAGDDGDASEVSDLSPMNAPTHLQQLFDNKFLDSYGNDGLMSEAGSDKVNQALLARARTKLQALIPPKADIEAISTSTSRWLTMYNTMFPPFTMFTSVQEMLAKYDALMEASADPLLVAGLLLWVCVTAQNTSPNEKRSDIKFIKEGQSFVRQVSDTVEDVIVSSDTLGLSVEGIEVTLLWVRL